MVVVKRNPHLFHVVFALSPTRGGSSLLDSWQQQCHKNCNNRNDDK